MLRRVVLDIFDRDVDVAWDIVPPEPRRAPHLYRATLSAQCGAERRNVALSLDPPNL